MDPVDPALEFWQGLQEDIVADHGGDREAKPSGLLPDPQEDRSAGCKMEDHCLFQAVARCF